MKIKKYQFSSLIFVMFVSVLTLELYVIVYEQFIYKTFAYYGFEKNEISIVRHLAILSTYVMCSSIHRSYFASPTDFLMHYFNFLMVLPVSVMACVGAVSDTLLFLVVSSYLLIATTVSFGERLPKLLLNPLHLRKRFVTPSFAILALLTLSIFVIYKGPNLNFDFINTDIYAYRAESKGVFTGSLAYVMKWMSYCIFPFILIWGMHKKQKWLILLAVVGQIIIFGFTNHKSYFGNIVLIFVTFYLINVLCKKSSFSNSVVVQSLFLFASLAIFLLSLSDYGILGSLFFRRMFFWPSLISDSYVAHGLEYGFLNFQNSMPVADLVSEYMGRDEYTNTAFIANAFIQGGVLLVMAINVLVASVLILYNRLFGNRLPLVIMSCFCIITFRPLFASDFFVALLSNGVAFMFLLQLVFFNSKKLGKYGKPW